MGQTVQQRQLAVLAACDKVNAIATIGGRMKVFMNKHWDGKRDYECTQVVALVGEAAPNVNWTEANQSYLDTLKNQGAQKLWSETANGITYTYWGWL